TILLPASATAGLRRPRRGRGGACGPGHTHSHPLGRSLDLSLTSTKPVTDKHLLNHAEPLYIHY
ncbi:hypothetical protein T492DRAFT_1034450, partial [Pavlovales sp. CCMP2436]